MLRISLLTLISSFFYHCVVSCHFFHAGNDSMPKPLRTATSLLPIIGKKKLQIVYLIFSNIKMKRKIVI